MARCTLTQAETSDLIGLVYDSALETDQWHSLIARITDMFPGFFGWTSSFHKEYWLGMYTADGFNDLLLERWDAERTDADRVFSEMPDAWNDMRRVQATRQKPALGRILKSRDVFADEELHSFEFYKNKMKPMGIGHWIGLTFAMSGPRYASLAFAEVDHIPGDKDYEGLYGVMELLAPHVVRAMRISRALHLAKASAESFRGFLDIIALPLVVCDDDGILQFGNGAGRRMLARSEVMVVDGDGKLALHDSRDTDWLYRFFREFEAVKRPTGRRIEDAGGPISLCIMPFHPRMSADVQADRDVFDKRTLFAIFAGVQGDQQINPGLLRDVFSLTQREAEVCCQVVVGHSPADVSRMTGRAEKTIRNQVQAVFEKVGVNSVTSLIEALSVFRLVGAIFDTSDPLLFAQPSGARRRQSQAR